MNVGRDLKVKKIKQLCIAFTCRRMFTASYRDREGRDGARLGAVRFRENETYLPHDRLFVLLDIPGFSYRRFGQSNDSRFCELLLI